MGFHLSICPAIQLDEEKLSFGNLTRLITACSLLNEIAHLKELKEKPQQTHQNEHHL